MVIPDLIAGAKASAVSEGRDWLALAVAGYGAVVATAVAVYQFARDRPGVKVKLTPGFQYRQGKTFSYWSLRIVNHRKRTITILRAGLYINQQNGLGKMPAHTERLDAEGERTNEPAFPVTMADGEILELWLEREDCGRVEGAFAADALNRTYTVSYSERLEAMRDYWRYLKAKFSWRRFR